MRRQTQRKAPRQVKKETREVVVWEEDDLDRRLKEAVRECERVLAGTVLVPIELASELVH